MSPTSLAAADVADLAALIAVSLAWLAAETVLPTTDLAAVGGLGGGLADDPAELVAGHPDALECLLHVRLRESSADTTVSFRRPDQDIIGGLPVPAATFPTFPPAARPGIFAASPTAPEMELNTFPIEPSFEVIASTGPATAETMCWRADTTPATAAWNAAGMALTTASSPWISPVIALIEDFAARPWRTRPTATAR